MLYFITSISLLIVGVFFATFAFKYLFTSTDELYSDFRNEKDFGEVYFKRELLIKRFVFTILTLFFLSTGFTILFTH